MSAIGVVEAKMTNVHRWAKHLSISGVMAVALAGLAPHSAQAAVQLPDCVDPVNCLVFDDFSVYSLALLNAITNSDDFDQRSTPGFLKQNAITIGTGAGGKYNNNDNIDEPYDTPNEVSGQGVVTFESITP